MLIADVATTATAIFAAVAAFAAWATVMTDWYRQRKARQPNVSAGFLHHEATDQSAIEFVNMGPGLAIQLAYLLYAAGPDAATSTNVFTFGVTPGSTGASRRASTPNSETASD